MKVQTNLRAGVQSSTAKHSAVDTKVAPVLVAYYGVTPTVKV
jgi:hypothetical protein